MSKSVTYVGPYTDGVYVQPTPGDIDTRHFVVPGDTIELPDDIAEELVDRGEFVHASSTSESGAPAHSAPKDEWSAFRAVQGHDVDGLTKQELIDLPDAP